MAEDVPGGAPSLPPPSEEKPGWGAPPPSPAEDQPGWAAPPSAPFPTADGGRKGRRRLTPRGGHRRRKASGVGAIAVAVIAGLRLLLPNIDDPSSGTDFSLPPREQGEPVEAVELSSAQVCDLLTPADLRRIYDRRFQQGAPLSSESASAGGEPSVTAGTPDLGQTGICQWQTKPGGGDDPLTLVAFTIPAFGGDANGTYELLRPSSPTVGFDATSDIGDEAFFLMDPFVDPPPGYNDTMTLRSGGVVMTINITGPTKPEGGLDLLAEVGQAAAANLAAQGFADGSAAAP